MKKVFITGIGFNYGQYDHKNKFTQAIFNTNEENQLSLNTKKEIFIDNDLLLNTINAALFDANFFRSKALQQCLFFLISKTQDKSEVLNKISFAWNIIFQPVFLKTNRNSFFTAISQAYQMIHADEYHTAIIVDMDKPYGCGAVVLEVKDTQKNAYAKLAIGNNLIEQIDYLEIAEDLTDPDSNQISLFEKITKNLNCALGFISKTPLESSGIVSFIKILLCIKNSFIPATPTTNKSISLKNTLCDLPSSSRPWFVRKNNKEWRIGAIYAQDVQKRYFLFELSRKISGVSKTSICISKQVKVIAPIFAYTIDDLIDKLKILIETVKTDYPFLEIIKNEIKKYNKWKKTYADNAYVVSLVSNDKSMLLNEIDLALQGIKLAEKNNVAWETPDGSYFVSRLNKEQGKIVFVYPGFYCSYINMGRTLWQHFPTAFSTLENKPYNLSEVSCESEIYPKSSIPLSALELKEKNLSLYQKNSTMSLSSFTFAILMTQILKTYFHIEPDYSLGYSLGELKMLASLDVWTNPEILLNQYDSFSSYYHPNSFIKKKWSLITANEESESFWRTYLVKGSVAPFLKACSAFDKIYLPFINTPNECVVFGDPKTCVDVISGLGYNYINIDNNLVVHCPLIREDYHKLKNMLSLPTKSDCNIKFYSAAEYNQMTLTKSSIAHSLATIVCNPIDFPKLINRCYKDNGRIFIEIGPKNMCSNYIRKILHEQNDFITIPLSTQGMDDVDSIVKGMAKLLSYGINVNLDWFLRIPVADGSKVS